MAIINATNIAQDYNNTNSGAADFASFVSSTSTTYTYLTSAGHKITLTGTGITLDGMNVPTGGTVTSISIDLGDNNASNPDIEITNVSFAVTDLTFAAGAASNTIFWTTVLDGVTEIVDGSGAALQLTGDFVNPDSGFAQGDDDSFSGVGADNSFAYGDAVDISATATVLAGDDSFEGAFDLVYGDAESLSGSARLIGGDDSIVFTQDFAPGGDSAVNIYGDVDNIADQSVLIGGSDILDARSLATAATTTFGDADTIRNTSIVVGGDDIIYGGDQGDALFGDVGVAVNQSSILGGDDIIYGGDGNDFIYGDYGSNFSTGEVTGGNDRLFGEDGTDEILGNDGDDFISGGEGADTLNGGSGYDTADYSDSEFAVTVRLFNGTGSGGDAQGDTLTEFEAINGSAFNDLLIGDGVNDNILSGGDGLDSLFGLGGNDTLIGGAGADTLDGGASLFDIADYSTSDEAVTVRLFNNVNVGGDAEGDTLTNIEGITGSALGDILIGSSTQIDTIRGGDGDDAIFGLAGNDTLIGGAGADVIDGGASNKDTVDYSDASAGVIIRLFDGTGERAEAEGDIISNVERVVGSDHNDTLVGANGLTDFLVGGLGNDSLFGLSGNDFIEGNAGNDMIEGGDGVDRLEGGGGNDNIDGGASFDTLFGGTGNDTLTGGTEADTFSFEDGLGNDSITDFEDGIDVIDVSGISGITDLADFMSIDQVGNDVVVQVDAYNSITIENFLIADLDSADFIFI